MKTKIIPFDIELAKKIQLGEVKGRIVNRDGYPARIICFDPIHPTASFIGLVLYPTEDNTCTLEKMFRYFSDGRVLGNCENFIHNLHLELPEETPKHEFEPFDKVLVRDKQTQNWIVAQYNGFDDESKEYFAGAFWKQCIPYEGNEHLVGTTNNP